jgi:hypothetical protein
MARSANVLHALQHHLKRSMKSIHSSAVLRRPMRMNQRMFDFRQVRPYPRLPLLVLFLLVISIVAVAQDKDAKDRDKDKGKDKAAGNYVKLDGKVRCEKPETTHAIEVPDRPGHALMLARRICHWIEPMELLGGKSKDGVLVQFSEKMEGTLHQHSFEVDSFDNGEKLTMQTFGQVPAEHGPADAKGRWSLMRGTGKYKGIKGGGTYEGKLESDDVLTLEFEGVYDPSEMVGEKK